MRAAMLPRCFLLATLGLSAPAGLGGCDADDTAAENGGADANASAATGGAAASLGPAAKPELELPPVDAVQAEKLGSALRSVDGEVAPELASAGLAELEAGRLPPSFIEGLQAITRAPPDQRAMLIAKSLSENVVMLNHLCGDGVGVMRSLATLAPEQRGDALFDGCKLADHGLVDRAAMAKRDGMMVLMGHLVFDHLSRGGPLHPGERAAIEAMISAPAPPPLGMPPY